MSPPSGVLAVTYTVESLMDLSMPSIAGLPTVERSSVMDAAFSSVTSLAKAAFGSENSCSTTWSCDG